MHAGRAVVRARLATTDWPATLRITAIDADTGELHTFDRQSGVPLLDAVSASGAVPGAAEDAAAMSAHAEVCLVAPDERGTAAIGPHPYDPQRRGPAAMAGRAQGAGLASTVAALW
ncbi:hypothetical protein ACWGCW_12530 [Streptomyces sp. NPDC054933]